MSYAQEIRNYVRKKYVEPALQRGDRKIQIRAGDVHKAMRFENRPAMVCQALASKIFLKENNLVLEAKQGPPSGQSTTVVFTYKLAEGSQAEQPISREPQGSTPPRSRNLLRLLELKGIGKEMFASLGGGENFIRSERKAFADGLEKQDRERGLL
jgi:hypothetical protein